MAQEPEQTDAAENIVQFTDVRRRRKSTVQNQTMSEPKGAPQDDEPPPDAA